MTASTVTTAHSRRRLDALWQRLVTWAPLTRADVLVSAGIIFVIGVAAHARHIAHGGWYLDDWSNAAITHYPPAGGWLDWFAGFTASRPVLILYVPLEHLVLGEHMRYHLAWVTLLVIGVGISLYVLLRRLRVPPIHALLIAALVVVFPFSDSVRMWSTGGLISLSLIPYLLGAAWSIALFERGARRRAHIGPLVLYALSALTYEASLGLIALSGLLYLMVAPWRAIRWRWAADIALAAVIAVWVAKHTKHTKIPLSDQLDHALQIAKEGVWILAGAALPTTAVNRYVVLAVIGAVLIVGVIAWRALPSGDERRGPLRRWLLLALGGFVVAAATWVVYVPADPYFTPFPVGLANRVNALASIGLVLIVYATIAVAVQLVALALRSRATAWILVPVACGTLLLVGYVKTLNDHITTWNAAFQGETAVIGAFKQALPDPPPNATIFTTGHPSYQALGVPVFSSTWDLNGAVKMQYNRGDISGFPLQQGMTFSCGADAITAMAGGQPAFTPAPYGRAFLIDVASGRMARPADRGECRRASPRFVPGPLYAG
jgi:hypothetical protein